MGIQSILWRKNSRMNSEVHNDTAPDSGGGVSAFETMVTEYREGQEKTGANNQSAPRVGTVYDKNMHHAHNCDHDTYGDGSKPIIIFWGINIH